MADEGNHVNTLEAYSIFDALKSKIFLIALCLFLAIGSARLILQELISLVIMYKKLKAVIRLELPVEQSPFLDQRDSKHELR